MAFYSDFIPKFQDFLFMKEELSAPAGIVIIDICLLVRIDIGIYQPGFFPIYVDISLVNADLIIAYRLDFRSLQNNTGFECIQNLVIKICFFV